MWPVRRLLAILAAAVYVISPVDVVPDFIPGLGWLDDLFVIGGLLWYLHSRQGWRFPWESQQPPGSSGRPRSDPPRPEEPGPDFGRMDPYALLEVPRDASREEIKAAYRRAVARYHPDKVAHLGKEFQELAHRKFLAIQEAYERLHGAER